MWDAKIQTIENNAANEKIEVQVIFFNNEIPKEFSRSFYFDATSLSSKDQLLQFVAQEIDKLNAFETVKEDLSTVLNQDVKGRLMQ
jgi:hypothetical protein